MNNNFCESKTLYEIDTLVFTWNDNSIKMLDFDYIACIGLLCESLNKVRPTKLLVDFSNFNYHITQEMRSWTNDTLFRRMDLLEVRSLFVINTCSSDIKNKLASLFYEEFAQPLQIKYCKDEAEALSVLSKCRVQRAS